MTEPLAQNLRQTLEMVAERMTAAKDPWWIIGSSAVALHGCPVSPADVDVLLSVRDARALLNYGDVAEKSRINDALFTSEIYAEWAGPPLTVEFMAGLRVRGPSAWEIVLPVSREECRVGSAILYVPGSVDLRSILHRFGREKDIQKAALLAAI